MSAKLSHPFDTDTDITLGGADGQVKLVWYIDYTSPASAQVRGLLRRTVGRFGPRDVSLAVRQAPSTQRQPDSDIAARAAVAAAQGRFQAMHSALFAQDRLIDAETVQALAVQLGLDTAQFEVDNDADKTGAKVAAAIPARPHANPKGVAAQAATVFETDFRDSGNTPCLRDQSFRILRHAFGRLRDPGFHLEQQLQTWSSYAILPLFAFFNTGIAILGSGVSLGTPASLGVIGGW